MLGQIRSRQDEIDRRQADFQAEMLRMVAEIHRDNQGALARHLEYSQEIQREVFRLREDVMKRFAGPPPAAPLPSYVPPRPTPLRMPPAAPASTPENPEASVNWLIARAGKLDQENRKGWKDLLTRLSGRKTP